MTLLQRLYSRLIPAAVAHQSSAVAPPVAIHLAPATTIQPEAHLPVFPPTSDILPSPEPLPDWLTDEEAVRDEGVLFGLSAADPGEKVATIRAYFSQQAAVLEHTVEHHSEKIGELNLLIEQRETRINDYRRQIDDALNRQPLADSLIRTVVSLCVSVLMAVGNFFLIDQTLRPVFSNPWVSLGVFLAGMFTVVQPTPQQAVRPAIFRLLETVGLPLATAGFVLAQALRTQPIGQALALFFFVFFLFLLSGRLVLDNLTRLRHDISVVQSNRRLNQIRRQTIPHWETRIDALNREIDQLRIGKWPVVTALTHTETDLARLNARRDGLITLFLSEYELARHLRDKRKLIINDE